MSDSVSDKMPDKDKFSLGYADADQDVVVLFVPVKHYANDPDGTAMVRGKLDEAKSIILMKIQEIRHKKTMSGVIRPINGTPLGVA